MTGEDLRQFREEHKLSLRQFSKIAGYSHGYLQKLEAGERDINSAVKEILLCTMEAVIEMEEEKLRNDLLEAKRLAGLLRKEPFNYYIDDEEEVQDDNI